MYISYVNVRVAKNREQRLEHNIIMFEVAAILYSLWTIKEW